jgi:glycosyltransferase involved in cell wall biosynthesis
VNDRPRRLLFASTHGYVDPSSGAARATRDVLEMMAARGWECRALCSGALDYEQDTPLGSVLDRLAIPYDEASAALGSGGEAVVFELELEGVAVTAARTRSSRPERAPDRDESRVFLDLARQILDRFRPDVVLTYGGHPANRAMMAEARTRGAPVVFHLHNFAYVDADPGVFADVAVPLVPTDYARRLYARRPGLRCTFLPLPLRRDRVLAVDRRPRYVTFVNPQLLKGVAVVARIALELGRRRPEIPLLIVEGRAGADDLGRLGLDLSGLENLHRMANTPDPRDFYGLSRVALVPSLVENAALTAREAMFNGIPVLASDRGGLPETLGDAGFLFALPERLLTPDSAEVPIPTAREVAPWVAAIEKIWDDPDFEARHRDLARAQALPWDADRLADRYERFFESLV